MIGSVPRSFKVERNVPIPMRDGVILRADVWLSGSGSPMPTLLQRLPYNKSDSFNAQYIAGVEPLRAVEAGFAVVIQDTRGRYESDGVFEPYAHEPLDGLDTIAWIRSQPFSNGKVAMYGASYVGATQLLAATTGANGLVAIAPSLTAAEYFDTWSYVGGAFQLGFLLLWVIESLAPPDLDRRRPGPETERARCTLAKMTVDPWEAIAALPVDRREITELAPYFHDWASHPTPDPFWQPINPARSHDRMDVAGLHIAGWNDIFLEGNLRTFAAVRREAPSAWARDNQRLIVGPWSHGNLGDWQGDLWLGSAAAATTLDMTAQQLAFFRAAVEGRIADSPRVRYFLMGANKWCSGDDWPPVGTRELRLYLRGDGTDRQRFGRLAMEPPDVEEPADEFVADPSNPVPTTGGATFLPGLLYGRNSGPRDQRDVEARSDVLVYTGEPLESDVVVTGTVRVRLHAASSATDCDWTARLVDVHPDGRAYGVVDGILRARYREGLEGSRPLEPGRQEVFEFPLGTTAMAFRREHRIRLQIASSNFPRFDRNPQQYIPVSTAEESDFRVARQTVYHDRARPSQLLLPVLRDGRTMGS